MPIRQAVAKASLLPGTEWETQYMGQVQSLHGQWRNRWTYFLAATGSAVGLGNIWKFPYVAGENGGGAFVLVYLVCIVAVGWPVLIAEAAIGRYGRQSPVNSILTLANEAGASPSWRWLGWLHALTGMLILSFYTVIAGWSLFYIVTAASGTFSGRNAEAISEIFTSFTGHWPAVLVCSSLFLLATMLCVGRGVEKGIEASLRYIMPGLLALLLILVGYSMASGEFVSALHFLFYPNFSALSIDGALIALGHAFFTLGVGAAAMMIYGAYIPPHVSLPRAGAEIIVADTLIALLAGLAIFPIVFASNLPPGQGPGLIFLSLPIAFASMPYGSLFGALFFTMLALAAFSSTISMIEGMLTIWIEKWQIRRSHAAALLGLLVWCLSLGTVFSFGVESTPLWLGKTFFDLLDYLTSNIMLPLTSLGTALFAGWVATRSSTEQALQARSERIYRVWRASLRFIAPAAIVVILLSTLDLLS